METTTYQCSPALHRQPGETCLPPSALEKMRKTWNRMYPDSKIPDPIGFSAGKRGTRKKRNIDTKQLWKQIREVLKKKRKCDTEYCFVESIPGGKKEMKVYFRPDKPDEWDKQPTTWLDSYNIEDVMNQYEEAYPTFEFIGPVPIDFDSKSGVFGQCIVNEMCNLNLKDVAKKGTQQIGVIYNLDAHDEPGSHWVCSFVDIPKKTAYYFDSYGYEPPKEIETFLKRCKEQGCEKVYYNDIRHQRKGSECGMYCLFTIICLLKGRSFFDICSKIVDDDTINAFRDILFSTDKPRRDAIEKALPRLCI